MTTIQEYYKLKEIHEKKKKSIVNSVKSQNITLKEKKDLIKKKYKCHNCKKPGGIKFYSTYDKLLAECNAETKCEFKINIEKSHSKYIPHLNLYERINHLKELLIEIKTQNLFRYLNDEDTVSSMENVISNLEESTLIYKKINKEKDNSELKRLEEVLVQIVNEMKDKTASENIEIYNTILKETLEEIRNLKYISIENNVVHSKEGVTDLASTTFNKVIFSREDITHYTLDIKSI